MIDASIQSVGQDAASAAGSAFSLMIIPFVTYFALAEGDRATKRLLERVPNKYFEMTLNVVHKIQKELGWKPKYQDIKTIVESAWSWHVKHPQGYGD